jgi:hypothetical protein
MSVRQVLEAAARAGISVTIDGPDLVVEDRRHSRAANR